MAWGATPVVIEKFPKLILNTPGMAYMNVQVVALGDFLAKEYSSGGMRQHIANT